MEPGNDYAEHCCRISTRWCLSVPTSKGRRYLYTAFLLSQQFSQNKTSKWFKQKSSEEKERLLQAARKLSKVHRRTFRTKRVPTTVPTLGTCLFILQNSAEELDHLILLSLVRNREGRRGRTTARGGLQSDGECKKSLSMCV